MRRGLTAVAVVILALVLVSSAMAATVVQTQNFAGTPGFFSDLLFNKFDTSLGTLTSVQVVYSMQTAGGRLTLDNDGWDPASGNYEFGATGSLSSTDIPLLNGSYLAAVAPISVYNTGSFSLAGDPDQPVAPDGDYNSDGPDGAEFLGSNASGSGSGYIGSGVMGNYNGPGSFTIRSTVGQWINYGSIGGIEYAVSPVSASGYVQVVYTYTAVPEPASFAGLLSGLAGLGLFIRRRK